MGNLALVLFKPAFELVLPGFESRDSLRDLVCVSDHSVEFFCTLRPLPKQNPHELELLKTEATRLIFVRRLQASDFALKLLVASLEVVKLLNCLVRHVLSQVGLEGAVVVAERLEKPFNFFVVKRSLGRLVSHTGHDRFQFSCLKSKAFFSEGSQLRD